MYGLLYFYYDYVFFIVYCDIKVSNVLFDEDLELYILDFGVVKVMVMKFKDKNIMLFIVFVMGMYGYIVFGNIFVYFFCKIKFFSLNYYYFVDSRISF